MPIYTCICATMYMYIYSQTASTYVSFSHTPKMCTLRGCMYNSLCGAARVVVLPYNHVQSVISLCSILLLLFTVAKEGNIKCSGQSTSAPPPPPPSGRGHPSHPARGYGGALQAPKANAFCVEKFQKLRKNSDQFRLSHHCMPLCVL